MRKIALVFAGGFCGTLERYLLSTPLLAVGRAALPGGEAGYPYDIFLINLSGALALGLLYGLVERGAAISPDVRLTVGTGFLGAYTTFSSYVVGGDKLLASDKVVVGVIYLLASILLGVAAAHGGYWLSGVVSERPRLRRRERAQAQWARFWWRRLPFRGAAGTAGTRARRGGGGNSRPAPPSRPVLRPPERSLTRDGLSRPAPRWETEQQTDEADVADMADMADMADTADSSPH